MRRPFFPVGLNLEDRACLVIGAAEDREAIEKTALLEASGARVRRIMDPSLVGETDVRDAFFVISTPQDADLSKRLRRWADRHRVLLCCIDQPAFGFVAMMAIAQAGPVRIAMSTAGLAPRVGKAIKAALQAAMDARFERFIERLARRRERTRAAHPLPHESELRRADAIEAARGFSVDVRFVYPPEERDGER